MSSTGKHDRETDLDRINKLVNWYEQNNPKAGQRILVALSPKKLAQVTNFPYSAMHPDQKEFPYRGRTLVATGTDK